MRPFESSTSRGCDVSPSVSGEYCFEATLCRGKDCGSKACEEAEGSVAGVTLFPLPPSSYRTPDDDDDDGQWFSGHGMAESSHKERRFLALTLPMNGYRLQADDVEQAW